MIRVESAIQGWKRRLFATGATSPFHGLTAARFLDFRLKSNKTLTLSVSLEWHQWPGNQVNQ